MCLLVAVACGSDDEKPAYQFSTEDITLSLANANIYYVDNIWDYVELDYRTYAITDGTYDGEGAIRYQNSFDNASYHILVYIGVPKGSAYKAGKYPNIYDWYTPSTPIAYIDGRMEDYEFETSNDSRDETDVVMKGGMDDGSIITISYKGTLQTYYYDNIKRGWFDKKAKASLLVKGKVKKVEYPD